MRTLKNLISLRQAAAAFTLLVASQAQAGHFSTAEFGPARAEDIADLVTEAFTQHFPHDRWSIFLYSSVTLSSRGEPHCYAIAGVTPMGQGRFPVKSYSSHAQRMESQSMTPGEQREFAASCARRAVQNLMSDELDNMYVRPGSKRWTVMKIIKRLFGQRRWLAWLPVPAAALLSGGSLGGFFEMLMGGCIWWIPYWLACWLSDRFTTFNEDGALPEIIITPGVDPVSGGSCTVVRCGRTGMPMAYGGGGHHHRHH